MRCQVLVQRRRHARIYSWAPALPGAGVEAESVVLRGARRGGAPASTSQAAAALDASLLQEGKDRTPSGLPLVHRCLVETIQQAAAALYASLLQEGEGSALSALVAADDQRP